MANSTLSSSQHQFKIWMPYITGLACLIGSIIALAWWLDADGSRLPWLIYPALMMVAFLISLWVFLSSAYPATRFLVLGMTGLGLACLGLYVAFFLSMDALTKAPVGAGIISLTISGVIFAYYVFGYFVFTLQILIQSLETALRYTNLMLAMMPGWTLMRQNRIAVLFRLGQYENALLDCNIVITESQSGAYITRSFALDGYTMRCGVYIGLREYDKALQDADAMSKLSPEHEYVQIYRIYIYLCLNNLQAAESALKKGFALNKLSPREETYLHLYHGEWHYAQQDYEQALNAFKAALKIPAESNEDVHASVYVCLGKMDFLQGNTDSAKAHMEQAHGLYQYDVASQIGLAIIRYTQGEREAAVNQWRVLVADHPKLADADWVVQDYYQWTPAMAEVARQIIAEVAA